MGAISTAGNVNKNEILRSSDVIRALQCLTDLREMLPVLILNEEILQF